MIFKILFVIVIAILWRLGGMNKKAWCRDIIIPILMGSMIGYYLYPRWWIGFVSIGAFQIIKMGYGIPDDDDDGSALGRLFYVHLKLPYSWLVRGTAGGLYALIGLSVYTIFTQQYLVYLFYAVLNFTANALGEKLGWKDYVVEPVAGVALSTLVFFL